MRANAKEREESDKGKEHKEVEERENTAAKGKGKFNGIPEKGRGETRDHQRYAREGNTKAREDTVGFTRRTQTIT